MGITIIIKDTKPKGRRRSKDDRMLRASGWGGTFTEEQRDKCEFIERKRKKEYGIDDSTVSTKTINELDRRT